ncbi:MAG: helix-turn-helix domain-containing protein [Candidatus Omnitrophica bacterium]|nr:helix-turn-helix domain-containing protein [Candidatus Omnitrophota bacterium]
MAKKKRNHNPNIIKARRSYTFTEIAEILKIHPRTVQSWRKRGLKVIDEATKPYLVYGVELRQFLRAKRQRHPLKIGEFYCPKCKKPRRSRSDSLSVEITNKMLGKISKQAFIRGICEVCSQRLILFSSDRKVQKLKEAGLLLQEHKKILFGIEDNSYNTDIKRGEI